MAAAAPPMLSDLVDRAVELAAEWHDGTYRKGRWRPQPFAPPAGEHSRVPAMAHVTSVALMVQRAGWEDEVVAAAFLHDVLEDANRFGQRMTPEALAAHVGPRVVALVQAVSEPVAADGGALPWRARKEGYLRRLRAGPPEAAAIALADKVHNAYVMTGALEAGANIFRREAGHTALSAGPEAQRWFLEAALGATAHHDDARLGPMRARLREHLARFAAAAEAFARDAPGD
ncbi:MAG: HD domain-containing protein [Rubricoccaceae bacterium]